MGKSTRFAVEKNRESIGNLNTLMIKARDFFKTTTKRVKL